MERADVRKLVSCDGYLRGLGAEILEFGSVPGDSGGATTPAGLPHPLGENWVQTGGSPRTELYPSGCQGSGDTGQVALATIRSGPTTAGQSAAPRAPSNLLVARANTTPGIAVKILVERDVIPPVRIVLEQRDVPEHGAVAVSASQENLDQAM